jgi:3-deoxy-D-manno-octulosonic acid (KDO) 8-phosphate synthase
METHLNPKIAKSDAANAIKFSEVEKLWKKLIAINEVVRS